MKEGSKYQPLLEFLRGSNQREVILTFAEIEALMNNPLPDSGGIAIGRFYSFAPHRGAWTWCYLIWLDKLSPSAAITVADIAWEDDLEPLEDAA